MHYYFTAFELSNRSPFRDKTHKNVLFMFFFLFITANWKGKNISYLFFYQALFNEAEVDSITYSKRKNDCQFDVYQELVGACGIP